MYDPFNAVNNHRLAMWDGFVSFVVLGLTLMVMLAVAVYSVAVGNWTALVLLVLTPLGLVSIVGVFVGLLAATRRVIKGDWTELEVFWLDLKITRLERRVAKAGAKREGC